MGASAPSHETPLVLVGHEDNARVVLAADTAARRSGIAVGMPATKAQALLADLVIMDADQAADTEALSKLALWAQRLYAPFVACDPPDGLMIDITGAAHLLGGEDALLKDIVRRLTSAAIDARAAVAPTYGAAYSFARYVANPIFIANKNKLAGALGLLPVAALRLDRDIVITLRQLGIERIGELEGMMRAPLSLRFGPLPGCRLDQAYGRIAEPFESIAAPQLLYAKRNFAEPIAAAETITRYIGKLVDQLCIDLETKALGTRKLDLLFFRVDSQTASIRVGTAKPVRDVKRLTRLLCGRLEMIDPGFGIEKMILAATIVEPLDYRAVGSTLLEKPVPDISGLLDTLTNRVSGGGNVYRLTAVESDIPERALKRVAPLAPATGASWPVNWPRPTRLLNPPESIETVALLPDHPPAAFIWRGQRRRIKRADGPERVFGEWWKRDAEINAVRDYFQVEDDAGERFWLFLAGDGENPATGSQGWFIHGLFA